MSDDNWEVEYLSTAGFLWGHRALKVQWMANVIVNAVLEQEFEQKKKRETWIEVLAQVKGNVNVKSISPAVKGIKLS